ncbi:MAG: pyruvate kinase [Myxococcota bacterium]
MRALALDLTRVALKRRRTKIVATVGPSSSSPQMLAALIDAGVNVFRLNFSHGTHASHEAAYQTIRAEAAKAGHPVAVLADLCGPKIRVGRFEGGGIELVDGGEVTVTVRAVTGRSGLIPSEYPELARDVKVGDRILLDDGKIELEVRAVAGEDIACEVLHGGRLSDRKGMNLPGVAVSAPALTDKDRADAVFAAQLGVDYLALSFVRQGDDVRQLKELLRARGADTPVIAKIEKPEALERIGDIVLASDGIMVARGDLGVEMAVEEVPLIQQELVRLAVHASRPVIVATQMLESMIDNPHPTRAEVSDVAAAAMASADAVMLSGETAAGRFPLHAVRTMDRVLRLVEGYQWKHGRHGLVADVEAHEGGGVNLGAALARAASLMSREVQVRAVVVPTRSGRTAREVASRRPAAPVVAATDDARICRRLNLMWGVTPELVEPARLLDVATMARELARQVGLASEGEHVLLVWDFNLAHQGLAPTVTILAV